MNAGAFWNSVPRYHFSEKTDTNVAQLWDPATGTGRLANYLLDPLDSFEGSLTKSLSGLSLGRSLNASDVATRRFEEDISVINFFFDTPIITRY